MTCSAEHSTDSPHRAECGRVGTSGRLRGLLTDVLRFSLHDGPGIRTTVFFKGCPLHCPWCHNPETQLAVPELEHREERCVRCGECVRACGGEDDGTGFSREKCRDMETAAAACHHDGLRVTGRWWSVDEVIAEVMKDAAYYAASGGGVTLSGGEPLMQAEFAAALLAAAKVRRLHTCVETCGYVAHSHFSKLLPIVDLLLFDWKMSDPEKHAYVTGVPNDLILANLELAVASVPVVLRCPLVPGVNDTQAHLETIVALANRLPFRSIEVLPYHSGGVAKYARYDRVNPLPDVSVDDARAAQWLAILKSAPCAVTIQAL